MADTTTTNLGLTKPEIGASANTWGTKLNADLDAIDALFPSGDLAVVNGGTGSSTASGARTNLGAAAIASPAFTGTPTAPTAASGTNTTQIATTAFVQAEIASIAPAITLADVYPVGSIYINAASTTNPATLFGFGTWSEFGAGKVIVGQDTGDALFDTLQETGGSKDAIAVSHTHTFSATTSAAGAHSHSLNVYSSTGGPATYLSSGNSVAGGSTGAVSDHTHTVSGTTASTGSSGTNANVQPYIVVKMWRRTA